MAERNYVKHTRYIHQCIYSMLSFLKKSYKTYFIHLAIHKNFRKVSKEIVNSDCLCRMGLGEETLES